MIVPRVFKSRQRKRKNISIVLSSQKPPLGGGFSFRPGSFGPALPQRNGQRKKEDCGSRVVTPEGFSRRLKES